ncbi:MAG TPA: Uma2 family endonuclease [Gemmatimonadaceae bacterium]|nr:Uma2 family endonuclease [Gemmatimonadaceae bacterium]
MAATIDFYSGDMVRELNAREPRHWPRYETVHGELLVSPGPRPWHQMVVGRLLVALHQYLDREQVGLVLSSPSDISWGLPDVLVQPDVFVMAVDEARTLDWRQIRHLLLAIEVLSPSSVRADRFTKRRLYQEQATPLYWIVDADARSVEVWTCDAVFPRVERELPTWHPADASAPFTLSLEERFRPI